MDTRTTLRFCPGCMANKPADTDHFHKGKVRGFQRLCKVCRNAARRKHGSTTATRETRRAKFKEMRANRYDGAARTDIDLTKYPARDVTMGEARLMIERAAPYYGNSVVINVVSKRECAEIYLSELRQLGFQDTEYVPRPRLVRNILADFGGV